MADHVRIGTRNMEQKTFIHRFLIPLCVVLIPLIVSFFAYFNSARIENETLHQSVAILSGLILIACILFGSLVIYPLAFFRGARPAERIIACLIPAMLFDAYEVYVASGVFSCAESLYYALNPSAIATFLLAFGFMGVSEIVCRWIAGRRGDRVRILTPVPIAAIVVLIIGIYVTLIWGNGAHFFYFYINSYLVLFKS